jgi:hypothetical protein
VTALQCLDCQQPEVNLGRHEKAWNMADLTPEEIPQARVIAYAKALARGNGQEPPPYDPEAAIGDFWEAAGEVIAQRPVEPCGGFTGSTGASLCTPFAVHSVHFSFPGSPAILLKDPVTDDYLGDSPEWCTAPMRDVPVAYVRATRPPLRVVFRGTPAYDGVYSVGAGGTPVQVEERRVVLTFDPMTGLSPPVDFVMRSRLPDQVGVHSANLDWYMRNPADSPLSVLLPSTSHRICTTWRSLQVRPADRLENWVYKQLAEWTCEWAAGMDNEKAICDAIVTNLHRSGLRYGVNEWYVREMLLGGGGWCGGWYQFFQQLAHCQGVFVHRRCFLVDWRAQPSGEVFWCALVVRSGGLNQPRPTHPASTFHDNDTIYPITTPVSLSIRHEERYRFWGRPGTYEDGHCINFLEYKGTLYLYDACFCIGPVEIAALLPPDNYSVLGGADLSSFKAAYLDRAVAYMLGTLYNGSTLHRSDHVLLTNGITVRTDLIPTVVGGDAGLTFYWGS